MLARGGAMSPYSGLGSTHSALVNRLENGLIEDYELSRVHEYEISKNPLTRLWKRWFSGPKSVNKMALTLPKLPKVKKNTSITLKIVFLAVIYKIKISHKNTFLF